MADAQNQQQPLMDVDSTFGMILELSYMDDDPSDDVRNARGELANTGEDASIQQSHEGSSYSGTWYISEDIDSEHTDTKLFNFLALLCLQNSGDNNSVTTVTAELQAAIEEFIEGWQQCDEKFLGRDIPADEENSIRQQLPAWNTFLQRKQDEWGTSTIISTDIKEDINKFIEFNLIIGFMGEQWTVDNKKWIIRCLQHWNKFLQARAGKTLVTSCDMFFTVFGLLLFLLDLVSDIGTAIYYAYMGQWWQAMLTVVIVYGTIFIHTVMKWLNNEIHCTGSADWLRYISSLLVNWPDVKQYGVLCRLEWKLYNSPAKYAHLVPHWHQRRVNVAYLKFMEGICEACPQAILQLCLLLPDLNGDLTWTDYLRIGSVCISLCTAGAALTNLEKLRRIVDHIDVPMCELVVLHVWAVPVTVSRLLSVALLLTVEPYWGLAGVALHVLPDGVYRCRTRGVSHALDDVLALCLATLWFFISPFDIAGSITFRRVRHAIHLLGNTVATEVWALGTPLTCSHPVLYTAIICFNAVMFVLGLVGFILHGKYWPHSYCKRYV